MEMRAFGNSDIVAFDYETTGFQHNPDARIFSVSFTWLDGHTEVHYGNFMQRLVDFWKSPCTGIAHNIKFELAFTLKHKIIRNPKKILHDTMIMSQYVDNLQHSHSLDYVATRYAGHIDEWDKYDEAVHRASKIYGTYDKIPKHIMLPYQKNDTERTMLLYRLLWSHVKPQSEYWNEIELVKTTMEFENNGIMVHEPNTLKLIKWAEGELSKAIQKADAIAGRHVNLLSVPQMQRLLFQELCLPYKESLDKENLDLLFDETKHPIIDCIRRARAYKNGISTIQSYLDLAIDGILYPNILTNPLVTGRQASHNPNMQNVRKEVKAGQEYTIPARQCFMPRPGHFLLLVDESGIEMRLGVQGTGSKRLIKLCAEDFDFHAAYATSFYGKRFTEEKNEKIKSALRSRAKNGRFARFYGAGLHTLSKTLGLPEEQVRAGIERDKAEFPEFEQYMDDCTLTARRTGQIETFFGRSLRVERQRPYSATDYCIQGSAAALFKHAQNSVHRNVKEVKILLPVHDELVMEVDNYYFKNVKELMAKIKPYMINFPQITVPLNAEFAIGKETWNDKAKAA
jgi:DNA polymerase I-like protein with 3'-5' exonuclease and polymerase domains